MEDLEELILWQNNIKNEEMKILLGNLKNCHNLKTLDLSDNYLKDDDIPLLIEVLKVNKNIKNLRIGDCNVSEEGSNELINFIENSDLKLEVLTFNYNEVENIHDFVEKLKNKGLKLLEIKGIVDIDQFDEIKEIIPECDILFESMIEDEEEDQNEVQK